MITGPVFFDETFYMIYMRLTDIQRRLNMNYNQASLFKEQIDLLGLSHVLSFPSDDEVKEHLSNLPYYGTCTTEYNEGFQDAVEWMKKKLS
jgi:hypothetical protein